VIIGILAAIAIPKFIAMQDRAREASVKENMHSFQLAIEDLAVQEHRDVSGGRDQPRCWRTSRAARGPRTRSRRNGRDVGC